MQPPGDGHRQLQFMLHIGRRSEKVESAIFAAPRGEQHAAHAQISMMLVSFPRSDSRRELPIGSPSG
jgi:hypothetical protein